MLNRLLKSLYRRLGIRSLSVKLLLPSVALILLFLLATLVAFSAGSRLARRRRVRQQTEAEFAQALQALNQRVEAVSAAGLDLAGDPDVARALEEGNEAALDLLNTCAGGVQDRFDLALVQVYDQFDVVQAESLPPDITWPGVVAPPLVELAEPGTPVVRAVGDRLLLLRRFPLLERAGVVVVGIDLKTELERIVVLEGLTSDLELVVRGVRVGAYAAGSGAWAGPASNGPPQDGPDALDGWVNDHYFRSRSITLGSSPARLLLVHSVDDTGRVTALGLIVMGSGMLFTLLSVSVLNGMMIRSIGRAVAALSRAARCLGNGELDKPVPPVPHPLTIGEDDELGVLAESFEEMVGGVRGLCADLEAEIEELEAELNTVAEIARAVASSLDSRAILHETVRILKTRLKAVCPGLHHVSIYLVEGNPRATTLRKAVGEAAGRPNRADVWVPLGTKSPVGMAVRSRRPEAVQNVKAASAHLKPPLLLETNSAAAAPLLIGDGLVGALSVESNQPNAFSPRALMLLATLADQIATGLQRARFGEVQQGSAEGYLDRDQTELR